MEVGSGWGGSTDFYPRPPRGGRHPGLSPETIQRYISIHALREEGDNVCCRQLWSRLISIHALREEGDIELQCVGIAVA